MDFVVGTANPSGLLHRAHCVAELPDGLWHFAETQLSSHGAAQFKAQLNLLGNQSGKNIRCLAGHPVPYRSATSVAGSWSGVMITSTTPIRELSVPWRGAEYKGSRVVVASTFFGPHQITSAAVYGAPKSPTFKKPLMVTEGILQTLTEEIVEGQQGMRIIAGDLNCDPFEAQQIQRWHDLGWREVQLFAESKWGQKPCFTCKNSTFHDYIWCSPECLPHLTSVHVKDDIFPDHSVVYASLRLPRHSEPSFYWHMPQVLPWQTVDCERWHEWDAEQHRPVSWDGDISKRFATWSNEVEASLDSFLTDQKMPLQPGKRGRGQERKPRMGCHQQPRTRPARPGEIPMASSFLGKVTHLWYKQLRRLQSLLHSKRTLRRDSSALLYQVQVWASIRLASGFRKGFFQWWRTRAIQLQSAPESLSYHPPTIEQLEVIFLDYKLNYKRFEQWQLAQRAKILQIKRETHLKEFFRTLKGEQKQKLDYLEDYVNYQITEVSGNFVLFDSPPALDKGSFTLSDAPATVTEVLLADDGEDEQIFQIDSDIIPVPGQTLKQMIPLTSTADIHDALCDLWQPRWNHDSDAQIGVWQRILAFAGRYLPKLPFRDRPVSPHALRSALRQGTGLATRGPDAWGKDDILHLGEHRLQDLSHMYHRIETGGSWPDQLVQGHVTCLEKQAGIPLAQNFRPVVLFSLLYRLWGSIKSRALLLQMSEFATFASFGFLKQRQCSDVTYWVQAAVETSYVHDEPLVGLLTDITRCFNYLPRLPILWMARALGIPSTTLAGWGSFLKQTARRFRVRNALSAEIFSSSGFPEGDSLSCLAMTVASWSLHLYMYHYGGNIAMMSFVDNLEMVGGDTAELVQSFQIMKVWASMLSLTLDDAKTMAWGTLPHLRKALHNLGLNVVEGANDLGASMVYGCRLRNGALTSRIKNTMEFFQKLRFTKVSRWHKCLGMRMALWPRALHNASHTIFGRGWITNLRRGAMKALRANRAGANPILHLVYTDCPDLDPGFFVAWQCVRDFTRFLKKEEVLRAWWTQFCDTPSTRTTYGPFACIIRVCDDLQWLISSDLCLHTIEGFWLDICTSSEEQMKLLLEYCWKQRHIREVQHRQEFADLQGIDYFISFHQFAKFSITAQELLRCIWNGTFYHHKQKARFDATDTGLCQWCNEPDGHEHRALHCPAFDAVRQHFTDCVEQWHVMPTSLTHHALVSENPHRASLWRWLLLYQPEDTWRAHPCDTAVQHVFTDGSMCDGSSEGTATASWACILANTDQVIAADILPSLPQTINRAELYAVWRALCWSITHHCRVEIWTDSAFVYQHFLELIDLRHVPRQWACQDLWHEVLHALVLLDFAPRIHKVKAHRELHFAANAQDAWTIIHNRQADRAAKAAWRFSPHNVYMDTRQQMLRWHATWQHWVQRFQLFLVALAEHSLAPRTSTTELAEGEMAEFDLLDFALGDTFPNDGVFVESFPVDLLGALKVSRDLTDFGVEHAMSLSRWLREMDAQADFVQPVCSVELCIAYSLWCSTDLPVRDIQFGSGWVDLSNICAGESLQVTLACRLGSFMYLFERFLGVLAVDVERSELSKPCLGIHKPLPSFVLPWPELTARKVTGALSAFFRKRPYRTAADLARPWP